MGKEQTNKIHYSEICGILDAWIEEEEENEIKVAIEKVKPLIKVLGWTYIDDQDFSLSEEADKRKEFARNKRRYNEEYAEGEEFPDESENMGDKENIGNGAEQTDKVKNDAQMEQGEEGPEEVSTTDPTDEMEESEEKEGKGEKEENGNGKVHKGEREERDDSVILDEDLFHKLGYGITSKISLSSKDSTNAAILSLHYSSHNWDIKDYEKPDFNLFCFTNTFTLKWENNPANPAPTSTSTTSSITSVENNNGVTTTTTSTTSTTTTSEVTITSELPGPQPTDHSTLITGTIYGDKSNFTTLINFTAQNLAGLRQYLKYDDKDDIFFTEENFVMLLYFVAVCMSIEDQPFNETPALGSSRARRFFMKQILYELGAHVGQYKYIIENLSYAMQEIKEKSSQERYSFQGGSSSARIIFESDDEEESKPNTKRVLDDGHNLQDSKKIKQQST